VHLIHIITYENRLLVLCQWAWNYVTRGKSARLITGAPQPPAVEANDARVAACGRKT
jgi:NADH dehydrogenase